jgi:hypothetical protein
MWCPSQRTYLSEEGTNDRKETEERVSFSLFLYKYLSASFLY